MSRTCGMLPLPVSIAFTTLVRRLANRAVVISVQSFYQRRSAGLSALHQGCLNHGARHSLTLTKQVKHVSFSQHSAPLTDLTLNTSSALLASNVPAERDNLCTMTSLVGAATALRHLRQRVSSGSTSLMPLSWRSSVTVSGQSPERRTRDKGQHGSFMTCAIERGFSL